jgi:nitrite reductase/ring-hydroxylating ferredoxin subunit
MFENVFDWEHLPHIHPTSFTSVRCLHQGAKSLQCDIGLWPNFFGLKQQIQVHACRKRLVWIVTVKSGFLRGLTIRSKLTVISPNSFEVRISFFAPGGFFHWFLLGPLLWLSYLKIYSEDEAMMLTRQREIDRTKIQRDCTFSEKKKLGSYPEILKKLPYFVVVDDLPYILTMERGKLISFEGRCPHMLRPLHDCPIINNRIRCKWHGYEFPLETSVKSTQGISLNPGPAVKIIGQEVFLFPAPLNSKNVQDLGIKQLIARSQQNQGQGTTETLI